MIYLDNAATSWPKPPEVIRSMVEVLEQAGGNPGRSGHQLSIAAARAIFNTREEVAEFFGARDPLRVIFTSNATHAINLVLKGLLKPGDHVITSSIEHNAVMRPLRQLEKRGVQLSIAQCATDSSLDIDLLAKKVTPKTKLIVLTHASNVTGAVVPVAKAAEIAHAAGCLLLIDSAQASGAIPVNVDDTGIDFMAFTGHKELLGPPGIGGLVIGRSVNTSLIEPLICGGTGSRSASEEQPFDLPDMFESGTPNLPGIAGLGAGIKWIKARGFDEIRGHTKMLTRMLIEELSAVQQVQIHGTLNPESMLGIVSVTIRGKCVSDIGMRLNDEFGIMTRIGLHCAPSAHRSIGTLPEGTIRLAPGVFTTVEDVKNTVAAIRIIAKSCQNTA